MRAFCALAILTAAFGVVGVAAAADPIAVLLETADGVHVSGDYYPAEAASEGAPFVVLLHMSGSDRGAWASLVPRLHDAGFAVMAIDLRGHGQSATTIDEERVAARDPAVFAAMDLDVWGAYDWIAQQPGIDRSRFAIVGAGVGCAVGLRYAVTDRSVDAVVGLSPATSEPGLDARADIGKLKGRSLLFLATEGEADDARLLAKGGKDARTKVYPGSAVGTEMFGTVRYVEKDIVEFLNDAIGKPSKTIVYGSVQREVYHLAGSGWIPKISPTNLRHFSSRAEAERRGVRASRSTGPEDRGGRRREP